MFPSAITKEQREDAEFLLYLPYADLYEYFLERICTRQGKGLTEGQKQWRFSRWRKDVERKAQV